MCFPRGWKPAHRGFWACSIQWWSRFDIKYNSLTVRCEKPESHQKVTPSDFNENLHTGVSEHGEYNGEINLAPHIIVWPFLTSTGQTILCEGGLNSLSYLAWSVTNICKFWSKSEGVTFWWLWPILTSGGQSFICGGERTSPLCLASGDTPLCNFSSKSEGVTFWWLWPFWPLEVKVSYVAANEFHHCI